MPTDDDVAEHVVATEDIAALVLGAAQQSGNERVGVFQVVDRQQGTDVGGCVKGEARPYRLKRCFAGGSPTACCRCDRA